MVVLDDTHLHSNFVCKYMYLTFDTRRYYSTFIFYVYVVHLAKIKPRSMFLKSDIFIYPQLSRNVPTTCVTFTYAKFKQNFTRLDIRSY